MRAYRQNQLGISLVESLLVVMVIGSTVFLIANIPNALLLSSKSRHMSLAREIAVKQIEDKRAVSFINLANDSSPISDARLGLLPGGSGILLIEDCPEDICSNNEAVKEVTAAVSWTDNNKPQAVTIKTLIGEGGINQ